MNGADQKIVECTQRLKHLCHAIGVNLFLPYFHLRRSFLVLFQSVLFLFRPFLTLISVFSPGDRKEAYLEHVSAYWHRMGRVAELQQRKLDAMGFYENALKACPSKRGRQLPL